MSLDVYNCDDVPDFTPPGADRVCESGPVRILGYPDGTHRVEHCCDCGDRGVIRCAPQLGDGHRVEWAGTWPTVHPSILCPDCGLHGFMRSGTWEPA